MILYDTVTELYLHISIILKKTLLHDPILASLPTAT